jgi:hypothetical protein
LGKNACRDPPLTQKKRIEDLAGWFEENSSISLDDLDLTSFFRAPCGKIAEFLWQGRQFSFFSNLKGFSGSLISSLATAKEIRAYFLRLFTNHEFDARKAVLPGYKNIFQILCRDGDIRTDREFSAVLKMLCQEAPSAQPCE